ncbi:MAG: hypothetical protein B7Y39_07215 [Bdellovibrio sp. 28-41-41]|nr:MAG: hypothetical protein B7Y39_07215 [Bdellovibrio sp. 28-41-41]
MRIKTLLLCLGLLLAGTSFAKEKSKHQSSERLPAGDRQWPAESITVIGNNGRHVFYEIKRGSVTCYAIGDNHSEAGTAISCVK